MIDHATLTAVNLAVNHAMIYTLTDHWSPDGREGDCKSYAMAKLQALLALGAQPSDLTIAIVRVPFSREGHVVLEVNTPEGIEVLDSLTDRIEPASTVFPAHYFLMTTIDDPFTLYMMENDH